VVSVRLPLVRKMQETGRVAGWFGKYNCETCNGTSDWDHRHQILAAIKEGCEQYSAYDPIPKLIHDSLSKVRISDGGRSACNLHENPRTVRAIQWSLPDGRAHCFIRVDKVGKGLRIGVVTRKFTGWEKGMNHDKREARYYASHRTHGAIHPLLGQTLRPHRKSGVCRR